ncbi:carbohydrate ABC transporter permease [Rhodobacteraceae bacterium NNCM2]|nr:carbohydrate ABC transporter permease [Coraliihabitans acroporae]
MRTLFPLGLAAFAAVVFMWSTPILWMLLASVRPESFGALDMASLLPDTWPRSDQFAYALQDGDWAIWFTNTLILVTGTLVVQLVTITLAGYAFARMEFPGKDWLFYIFLFQLMLAPPVLIVPNLTTLVQLGLYDTLIGVMAPYWGSAFGTFLMRQTFRAIPRDFEEAALIDGASWGQILWLVLLPLARPGIIAFSIVSVVFHWNEYLWPLMVISNPDKMVLTVGLVSFALGAEGASDWGLIAAGTLLVVAPLAVAFILFQRQFVNSFMSTGIK